MSAFTLWIKPVVYYDKTTREHKADFLACLYLCNHSELIDIVFDYSRCHNGGKPSIELWIDGSGSWSKRYYPC